MFGGKDKRDTNGAPLLGAGGGGLNSLVKDTHIEGTIRTASDIRIEGTLVGDLDCQAKLIIGTSGRVEGQVSCRTAMIEGHFEGTLHVGELLEVRETAKVSGDITYGKLKIDSGAVLTGQLQMVGDAGAPAPARANGQKSRAKEPVLA